MPFDFPSNPSQDQEYEDYKYQVPYTAWLSDAEKTGYQQRIAAKEDIVPAGTIHLYAGTTAPSGFLLCQGQTVSRNTYPTLFAAIGTNYGAGNGSTTFGIPDMTGRVAVGKTTSGTFATLNNRNASTTETHTLTVAEMPSHTHTQQAHTHTQQAHTHTVRSNDGGNFPFTTNKAGGGTGYFGFSADGATNNAGVLYNDSVAATNQNTTATNQDTGGNTPHNNLQPYIVLNYIIKT